MTKQIIRTAVLGASGYTGGDMIRLAARHPNIKIAALIAKGHAGQPLGQVFPHLASLNLPNLVTSDEVDWSTIDLVFCGLPHGTAHQEIAKLPRRIKIIDMSADFRLNDLETYAEWYSGKHGAPELAKEAVYGLTEHNGEKLKGARLVACPGCYPTAVLLALLPLVKQKLISIDDIIIDAKSGVSGAGRTLKQNILFSEAGEGVSPYGIGSHRHVPEIEQELAFAAKAPVAVNFTSARRTCSIPGRSSSSAAPTKNQRSAGNAAVTAVGASNSGERVSVHVTGRAPIGAPNRYRAVTFPLIGSPATGCSPANATSTRKSGRRYAATRNEPLTTL